MIDSNTVAAALIEALTTDGITVSNPVKAQATLATLLAPLISHAATISQIETDGIAPLDGELNISVPFSKEQTDSFADLYDQKAKSGSPIPGTRPGPMNWPDHDVSNEDITLRTIVGLKQALKSFAELDGPGDTP